MLYISYNGWSKWKCKTLKPSWQMLLVVFSLEGDIWHMQLYILTLTNQDMTLHYLPMYSFYFFLNHAAEKSI